MQLISTSERRRNRPTAVNSVLIAGIVATMLVTVFGGTWAAAVIEASIRVHDGSKSDTAGTLFKSSEFPSVTRDYTMKKPNVSDRTWSVEGVPLINILDKKYESDPGRLGSINFVFLRTKEDSKDFLLVPKSLLENDPPVVLTSKVRDASDEPPVKSPAIVFPAAGDYKKNNRDISEQFTLPESSVDVTASSGEILSVSIKAEKMSDGNYRFSVPKKPSDHGSVTYQWFLYKGDEKVGEYKGSVYKATGMADSTAKFTAYLYVTTADDSAGNASKTVTGSKKDDQKTKSDSTGDSNSTNNGTGTTNGSGTGTGNTTGATSGTGTNTYKPPTYDPPKSTIPPVTPSTGASNVDNSGLSQAVTGLRGTGTARAVSGVLLSTPPTTPNPATAGADGQALEKLSAPLANAANNVFQPIQYPDNGWMLMVAVMFAAFILGGVKEFRNP